MGLVTSRGTNAGDTQMWGHDRMYKPDATGRGVIWCHAYTDSELEAWGLDGANTAASRLVSQQLTGLRMPVVSLLAGGNNWGNDAAQANVTAGRTFVQGTLGAKAGKVILAGVSMGGLLALNWARANPTLVEALVLFYPAVNLVANHDGTGGATNYATAINTAYTNQAGYDAAKATHDPAQNAAAYTGVPIKLYYSTADDGVGTANQTAFIAAVGGSALSAVSLGAAVHPDMSAIPLADVRAFAAAHA